MSDNMFEGKEKGELKGSFRVIGPDGEIKQEGKIVPDRKDFLDVLNKFEKELDGGE